MTDGVPRPLRSVAALLLAALLLSPSPSAQAPAAWMDLARTPPMGWNSWNTFACDVSETLLEGMADAMVASGMKAAGYRYVVVDDCWQVTRDSAGRIVADPARFPSGIKAVADYIDARA